MLDVIEKILNQTDKDVTNENANVSGAEPQGIMAIMAGSVGQEYALEKLLNKDVAELHRRGYIHIHDLDYYPTGTTTCLQIPVGKLLKDGFSVKDSHMREPSNITSAFALVAVIFQIHQNMQHGGQAMSAIDVDLEPYVAKTFEKHRQWFIDKGIDEYEAFDLAKEKTIEETNQAAEAFVHNMNSMTSRGGGQTVFSSINFGLGTTDGARTVSRALLRAMKNGLGKGEQPIFPIMIFQLKEGVNMYEGDPNYDLFEESLSVTAERFFPNYVFLDADFNKRHYDADKPETWAASMGCRTRTLENVNGEARTIGRGNLSFTSINLPMIAIECETTEEFLNDVKEMTRVACEQLYDRYQYQISRSPKNFDFIYGQETSIGSKEAKEKNDLSESLKHGTLSVGFVGLAEAMVELFGKHHGESEEVLQYAIKTIETMKSVTDEFREKLSLNYAVIATPAESFAGKALKKTVAMHGIRKGVTDREYFTNSFHVPVWHKIPYRKKVEIEGNFHKLCLAGHITYVEVGEMPGDNLEAMKDIVYTMANNNIGYGAINIPVDKCNKCRFTSTIYDECPKCGSTDIKRIRRITGYLVGDMNRWNSGKEAEERDRVKHV